jgi:hypothetical protein
MRPDLYDRVLRAAPGEHFDVLGWLAYDAETEVRDIVRGREATAVAERNEARIAARQDELRALAERTEGVHSLELVGHTPYVRLRATAAAVERLGRSGLLQVAELDPGPGEPLVDLWSIAPAQAAEVINFSWSFSSGADGPLNVSDLYHDYITLIGPFTPYTLAAGNSGADPNANLQYTHNRSYNSLVVGASNDNGTAGRGDDTIAAFSSWRNHTTPSGDRELPEIVAPGQNVTVTGTAVSGTSFAAPIVAGTLACMVERNTNLAGWPEALKAIVMAAADCNVSGVLLNLTDSIDDRDGVGEVNTARAVTLSDPANYRNPGAAAATWGHAYGYMHFTSNFKGNVFNSTWNVRTDAGGRLNLVFVWDATTSCTDPNTPSTCSGGGPDADLNIYLYRASDNALVATSTSFDNNYEVFAGRTLAANTNYRLEIRKASTRTAATYYALAWAPFAPGCPNP